MKQRIFTLLFALLGLTTSARAEKVEINGIHYELNSTDHTASVTSGSNKYTGDVEIPQSITYNEEKFDITGVAEGAFFGCGSLTSINLPDGVASIGGAAFSKCNSLTSINLPDGVTSIGSVAFYECRSLVSINIPAGVTSISHYAFGGCGSLTSINLPDGLTSIGDGAFSYCSSLTSINLPNGLTSIGNEAFYNCFSLTSIYIPNGVTSIGNAAFWRCMGLTAINVSDDNANYSSVDGVLYNKDLTAILCYPAGKSDKSTFIIPNSVTSIGVYAFANCSNLTSIHIPDGLTSIGTRAFMECNDLQSIHIPATVTTIGDDAFIYCTQLTSITVSDDNAYFCSVDGVLYSKDLIVLLCYPSASKSATPHHGVNIVRYSDGTTRKVIMK